MEISFSAPPSLFSDSQSLYCWLLPAQDPDYRGISAYRRACGPAGLGLVTNEKEVETLAQIGVVILLLASA